MKTITITLISTFFFLIMAYPNYAQIHVESGSVDIESPQNAIDENNIFITKEEYNTFLKQGYVVRSETENNSLKFSLSPTNIDLKSSEKGKMETTAATIKIFSTAH